MPGKKVKQPVLIDMADAFARAGHEPENGLLRCRKCGTTLHDFLRKGRLPCLVQS